MTRTPAVFALAAALTLALTLAAAGEAKSPPRKISLASASGSAPVLVGEQVQFMDASSGNPTSWSWDFDYTGDPATADSTDQNPLWTFAAAGTPSIRLEVCNTGGCNSAVKQVQVVELCTDALDLVLPPPLTITLVGTTLFQACHTITAGSGFSVVSPADVVFRAGTRVVLTDGFSVASGASFRVEIDPDLALGAP